MKIKSIQNLPKRLNQKLEAVREEEDAYAADELVELAEEIMLQLAAMGMAAYVTQKNQKEVFNDFLITLFLSNGHAYNAGPLCRWAANMIRDAEGEAAQLLRPFFWEMKDGTEVLNQNIHHLAGLRNAVMHGFFVLPPERNRLEAQKMIAILDGMLKADLFGQSFGDFHFYNQIGFTGHWNISQPGHWIQFAKCNVFGVLANRISHEYSEAFRKEEDAFALALNHEDKSNFNTIVSEFTAASQKLLEKGRGALVYWTSPNSENGDFLYKYMVQWLLNADYLPVYYVLSDQGVTFTSNFLEAEIGKALFTATKDEKALRDPIRFLKQLSGKANGNIKTVIVLHQIHIGLFNDKHLTRLFNTLYEIGVPIICTSWYYPFLNRFFNTSVGSVSTLCKVHKNDIQSSLRNYLRFKGPSPEDESTREDFEQLNEIILPIIKDLESQKSLIARRFAEENQYPIEFVHEAFAILSPFFSRGKVKFNRDEIDELYGFPKTIEESSRIYLSLRRRDVKLEYQHQVLTLT